MQFQSKSAAPAHLRTDCLALGVFADGRLSDAATAIDQASGSALKQLVRGGDFKGEADTLQMLHGLVGVEAKRVLLVGLGEAEKYTPASYRKALAAAVRGTSRGGSAELVVALPAPEGQDARWCGRQLAIATHEALYRFERLKSAPPKPTGSALKRVILWSPQAGVGAERGLTEGAAIARGADLTRDLGNLPANVCTPGYLADQARKIAGKHKLGIDVLERKQMQALGMNTLLSVAAGSDEPPKFIVIKHLKGAKSQRPVVLVGKGITFDTGGISLKPGLGMDEMKYDMCGAASVLGTMQAVAELGLPINVIGVVPTTENMPSGKATRPGDIVTSMSGQTVEILNTDAEGRLILCDALTYVERFEPECVIDIATLTGACITALGHVASGLLANDDTLAGELLAAGTRAGDRAWQLPLWEDYQEQLKSNFADMANIGGPPAGTITAACFLARFTKKFRWAHLDIAGTAWRSGKEKGATGRPVPLLSEFLLARAAVPPAPTSRKAAAKGSRRKA